jgi:hypothetical protein
LGAAGREPELTPARDAGRLLPDREFEAGLLRATGAWLDPEMLGKFAPVKPNVSGGANNPSLISRVTANQ